MLGLHPEVQQKAAEELAHVFGSSEENISSESLSRLNYLDVVIKETMRLFPVLPLSARQSTGEFDIGKLGRKLCDNFEITFLFSGNYTIPSGATVLISSFQVQRNPKYWGEDANKFRPERFEPEAFKKVHPYAYIPFTGGPRICIGWRYGMMFMKTVLANVLRKYEIGSKLTFEELEYEFTVSMKVVQRAMITLSTRQGST